MLKDRKENKKATEHDVFDGEKEKKKEREEWLQERENKVRESMKGTMRGEDKRSKAK